MTRTPPDQESKSFIANFKEALEDLPYSEETQDRILETFDQIIKGKIRPKDTIKKEVEEQESNWKNLQDLWIEIPPSRIYLAEDDLGDATLRHCANKCAAYTNDTVETLKESVRVICEKCLTGSYALYTYGGSASRLRGFQFIRIDKGLSSAGSSGIEYNYAYPQGIKPSDIDFKVIIQAVDEPLEKHLETAIISEQICGRRELIDTGSEIVVGRSRLDSLPIFKDLRYIEPLCLVDCCCNNDEEFANEINENALNKINDNAQKGSGKKTTQEFISKQLKSYRRDIFDKEVYPASIFGMQTLKACVKCLHILMSETLIKTGIEKFRDNFAMSKRLGRISDFGKKSSETAISCGNILSKILLKEKIPVTSSEINKDVISAKKNLNPSRSK